MLTYLGQLPVATISPACSSFATVVQSAYAVCLPAVSLPLADAQSLLAQLLVYPSLPDYAGMLATAQSQLTALLDPLLVPPPPVNVQILSWQTLLAALLAELATLTAAISAQTALNTLLQSGGIFAYTYSGPTSSMGGGMTSQLGSGFPGTAPGASTNALVFAAVDPVSFGAMQQAFPVGAQASAPTTTFLGSLTVGLVLPILTQLANYLTRALNLALPTLQGQQLGLQNVITFALANPPSIAQMIADTKALIATLKSLIALPIPPPGFDLAALQALIAQIGVTSGSLTSSLNLVNGLATLLTTGGLFAYLYSGATTALGSSLTSALSAGFPGGAPGQHCDAVVFAAVSAGAWASMQAAFLPVTGIALPASPPTH